MSEYIYRSNGEPLANERGEILLARAGEVVRCRDCKFCHKNYCETEYFDSVEKVVSAWNTRHDGRGTCTLVSDSLSIPLLGGSEIGILRCSECGELMFYDYNYCPNCGAKVVE